MMMETLPKKDAEANSESPEELSPIEKKLINRLRGSTLEMEEPDERSLAELEKEEKNAEEKARLVGDVSDDPVRLYLREIGRVELLDVNSEFRLATMIEGQRFVSSSRCSIVR